LRASGPTSESAWPHAGATPDSELTDQEIADLVAYFDSLPLAAKPPTAWRTPLPKGAPRGQELAIATIGCAQCHGATITTPRHGAAEVSGDFEWFKHQVYEHTTAQPEQWAKLDRSLQPVTPSPSGPPGRNRIRMGNYSRARLPETTLREIWDWMSNDLGVYLSVLRGRVTAGEAGPNGATYTVEVVNTGVG
jgi:cytochrome c553